MDTGCEMLILRNANNTRINVEIAKMVEYNMPPKMTKLKI